MCYSPWLARPGLRQRSRGAAAALAGPASCQKSSSSRQIPIIIEFVPCVSVCSINRLQLELEEQNRTVEALRQYEQRYG